MFRRASRIRSVLVILAVVAAAPSVRAGTTKPAQAKRKPAVLFVVYRHDMWNLYLKQYIREVMIPAGYEADLCAWGELTWERVRTLNAVVLVHASMQGYRGDIPEEFTKGVAVLERFLQAGGGLLVSPTDIYRQPQFQHLLGRYGATPYPEVAHESEKHTRVGTPFSIRFAYTDAVTPSPVTDGVSGVWYPTGSLKNWETLLVPAETDKTWQVVLRGLPSSHTKPLHYAGYMHHGKTKTRAKGFASSIPLFAIKDLKPGRLAYTAIIPSFTCYGGLCPGMERIVLARGFDDRPSHVGKLLLNTYRWLVEPSLAGTALGGFRTIAKRVRRAQAPPADWLLKPDTNIPAPLKQFDTVIGAQTTYSGGKSTPAEYKDAALKAGVACVVFLEDFARIDAGAFDKLRAECRRLCDRRVVLVPGLRLQDESGNGWYYFGPKMPFVGADCLTPQKRLRTRNRFGHLMYMGVAFTTTLRGRFNYANSPSPYWDLETISSMGVATYRDGRLVDECLDGLLDVNEANNGLSPCAIHLMTRAADLAAVPRTGQFRTVLLAPSLEKLGENITQPHRTPYTYVTQGPRITWQHSRNTAATIFNWHDTRAYHWRVRLGASSPDGIAEVRVMDGRKLFRRYLPKGVKQFTQDIDLLHEQQKHLMVRVTDTKGRVAVSDCIGDENWLMKDYWLADRHNKGIYAQQPAKNQWGFSYLWMPGIPSLQMLHGMMRDCLYHYINQTELTTPGFDGPPGHNIMGRVALNLYLPGGKHIAGRLFCHKCDNPMSSQDVLILDSGLQMRYPEDIPYRDHVIMYPVHRSEYYEGYQRYYSWNTRYGSAAISLVEGELKILKDVKLSDDAPMPVALAYTTCDRRDVADTFAAQHTGGSDVVIRFDVRRHPRTMRLSGPLPKGAYFTLFPSHEGSVTIFSLTDGLGYHYGQRGVVLWGWPLHGRTLKAGTVLRHRYAVMTGPYNWAPNTAMVEKVRSALGIGTPPTYKLALDQGRVISQDLVWRLDGAKRGVAGTFPVGKLPASLLVAVENMNDRWTSVLYERTRRRSRPLSRWAGTVHGQLGVGCDDTKLFIGHPFTCDQDEVFLTAIDLTGGKWLVQVQNPTERDLTVRVERAPQFDLVRTQTFAVTVPAGAQVSRTVP